MPQKWRTAEMKTKCAFWIAGAGVLFGTVLRCIQMLFFFDYETGFVTDSGTLTILYSGATLLSALAAGLLCFLARGRCGVLHHCAFDDAVNALAPKFEAADALIVGSPVYYASANGTLTNLLDRLFYSTPFDKTMKVGAAVVSCRRGGASATFDQLNKYFTISGMPVASSQYWNSIHGNNAQEAAQDAEGLQVMRTLGRNVAFLVKSIAIGKEAMGLPEKEKRVGTNFIR